MLTSKHRTGPPLAFHGIKGGPGPGAPYRRRDNGGALVEPPVEVGDLAGGNLYLGRPMFIRITLAPLA